MALLDNPRLDLARYPRDRSLRYEAFLARTRLPSYRSRDHRCGDPLGKPMVPPMALSDSLLALPGQVLTVERDWWKIILLLTFRFGNTKEYDCAKTQGSVSNKPSAARF